MPSDRYFHQARKNRPKNVVKKTTPQDSAHRTRTTAAHQQDMLKAPRHRQTYPIPLAANLIEIEHYGAQPAGHWAPIDEVIPAMADRPFTQGSGSRAPIASLSFAFLLSLQLMTGTAAAVSFQPRPERLAGSDPNVEPDQDAGTSTTAAKHTDSAHAGLGLGLGPGLGPLGPRDVPAADVKPSNEAPYAAVRQDASNIETRIIRKRSTETINHQSETEIVNLIFTGNPSTQIKPSKLATKLANEFQSKDKFARNEILKHGGNPDELLTFPTYVPTDSDYHERSDPITSTAPYYKVAAEYKLGVITDPFFHADLSAFNDKYWPTISNYTAEIKSYEKQLARFGFHENFDELQKLGIELNTDVSVIAVYAKKDSQALRNIKNRHKGHRAQIFAYTHRGETHHVAISPLDKDPVFKIPEPYKEWVKKNPYRFFFNQEDVDGATDFVTEFEVNHKTASMALHDFIYPMVGGITQTLSDMMNQETPLEKYIHNMRGYYDVTGIYSIYRAIATQDHKTLSVYTGEATATKILSFAQPLKHVFVRLTPTVLAASGMGISLAANVYLIYDSVETSLQNLDPALAPRQNNAAHPNHGQTHTRKKGYRRRPRKKVTRNRGPR